MFRRAECSRVVLSVTHVVTPVVTPGTRGSGDVRTSTGVAFVSLAHTGAVWETVPVLDEVDGQLGD